MADDLNFIGTGLALVTHGLESGMDVPALAEVLDTATLGGESGTYVPVVTNLEVPTIRTSQEGTEASATVIVSGASLNSENTLDVWGMDSGAWRTIDTQEVTVVGEDLTFTIDFTGIRINQEGYFAFVTSRRNSSGQVVSLLKNFAMRAAPESFPGIPLNTGSSILIETMRENISRMLLNYIGISVAHYRKIPATSDFYSDSTNDEPVLLSGERLLQMSTQEYDLLKNGIPHVETLLPIEVFLDPTTDWLAGDEVLIQINTEGTLYSRRFELVKVTPFSHSGVTIYQKGNIAPVRAAR